MQGRSCGRQPLKNSQWALTQVFASLYSPSTLCVAGLSVCFKWTGKRQKWWKVTSEIRLQKDCDFHSPIPFLFSLSLSLNPHSGEVICNTASSPGKRPHGKELMSTNNNQHRPETHHQPRVGFQVGCPSFEPGWLQPWLTPDGSLLRDSGPRDLTRPHLGSGPTETVQ